MLFRSTQTLHIDERVSRLSESIILPSQRVFANTYIYLSMHPLDSSKSCQQQELYIVVVCHIMHVSWNQPLPWMSSSARLKVVLSNSHNPTPPHSTNHNHTPRPNNPLTQLASQNSVSQSALYSRSHESITSPENTRSNPSVTTIDDVDLASQISKTLSPPCIEDDKHDSAHKLPSPISTSHPTQTYPYSLNP